MNQVIYFLGCLTASIIIGTTIFALITHYIDN